MNLRVDDVDQVGIDISGTDSGDMTSLDRIDNSLCDFMLCKDLQSRSLQ